MQGETQKGKVTLLVRLFAQLGTSPEVAIVRAKVTAARKNSSDDQARVEAITDSKGECQLALDPDCYDVASIFLGRRYCVEVDVRVPGCHTTELRAGFGFTVTPNIVTNDCRPVPCKYVTSGSLILWKAELMAQPPLPSGQSVHYRWTFVGCSPVDRPEDQDKPEVLTTTAGFIGSATAKCAFSEGSLDMSVLSNAIKPNMDRR
jgi:hypothetical protein